MYKIGKGVYTNFETWFEEYLDFFMTKEIAKDYWERNKEPFPPEGAEFGKDTESAGLQLFHHIMDKQESVTKRVNVRVAVQLSHDYNNFRYESELVNMEGIDLKEANQERIKLTKMAFQAIEQFKDGKEYARVMNIKQHEFQELKKKRKLILIIDEDKRTEFEKGVLKQFDEWDWEQYVEDSYNDELPW